ncbi:hypothetical protein [Psychroserpens algicola]|uniref:hypothetical protein n=1 Tax=Psychroserpens algicola TaxID=1719034 RepID=UPI0019543F7A|nr:hypothetical protein [Psychroserpens algicola]
MKLKNYIILIIITFFITSTYCQEGNNNKVTVEDQGVNSEYKENDKKYRKLHKNFRDLISSFKDSYKNMYDSGFRKTSGDLSKERLSNFISEAEIYKNNIKNNSQVNNYNTQLNDLAKVTSRSGQDYVAFFENSLLPGIDGDIANAKSNLKNIETNESKKEVSLGFSNTNSASSNTNSSTSTTNTNDNNNEDKANYTAEKTKANEDFDDGGQAIRNIKKRRKEAEAERQRMFKQSMDNLARDGGELLGNFIGNIYERKEKERNKKLEEKRIENARITEEKRIEEDRRITEEKRLNELKNKPEYVIFLDNALNDVFYFDSSGKEVDQENAIFEQVYIKQDNGFYVAKYFNLKEGYLAYDISYEIIPNPFIESLKTGASIKYGVLSSKDEINYYYRNKLKQRTLNFWWKKKMHFEFYNYKDEKVFGSGEILMPEIMQVSSSGAITNMEYKIKSKRSKFKNHRFKFDYKGNIESLYITNEKGKIEERYKFSKY